MAQVTTILYGPARTAIQAGPAWVVTEFIDAWWRSGNAMDDRQFAVSVMLLTIIFGVIQALIENRVGSAIFRKVTPSVPVLDKSKGETSD